MEANNPEIHKEKNELTESEKYRYNRQTKLL